MRLPGEEILLALGYCFSEGIIDSIDDVQIINYCMQENGNRVDIKLDQKRKSQKGISLKEKCHTAYSSCSICGKEMVEDIYLGLNHRENSFTVTVSHIEDMMRELERHQIVFRVTGATHAAAIFNRDCELLAFSEDVGRHNALDKCAGKLILKNKIGQGMAIAMTSRLSFEIVRKVSRSSSQMLIGISSATSLAVELARKIYLTLIGFTRKGQGNVYTGFNRVTMAG